jgi:hypothetical protein
VRGLAVGEDRRAGRITGEAKLPLFATIWWFLVSRFVQRTASVVEIVTDAGKNPAALIETPFVTVEAGWDAPVTASASTAATARTKLRIAETPL